MDSMLSDMLQMWIALFNLANTLKWAKYIWIKNYSVKQKHNNNMSKKFKEGNILKVKR